MSRKIRTSEILKEYSINSEERIMQKFSVHGTFSGFRKSPEFRTLRFSHACRIRALHLEILPLFPANLEFLARNPALLYRGAVEDSRRGGIYSPSECATYALGLLEEAFASLQARRMLANSVDQILRSIRDADSANRLSQSLLLKNLMATVN